MHKAFLVVGHPRSGTGYMAKLFQAYGFDVGHERMGEDGISAFQYAADAEAPWTHCRRGAYKFGTVIHVVREPRKVIASAAATLHNASWEYMHRFVSFPCDACSVARAVWTWVGWNKLIESWTKSITTRWRIQIETAEDTIPWILRTQYVDQGILPPKNYNAKPHEAVAESTIRSCVPFWLWDEMVGMAGRYGYSL